MKKRKKINTNVFFGFLAFMSILWFLVSFLFEGAFNIVFLSISFLFALLIPVFDFTENKQPYTRFNPLFYALASLIIFVFVDFYQGLLLLLVYALGITIKEFTENLPIRAKDVAQDILVKKFHRNDMGDRISVEAKDIKEKEHIELFSGEILPVDGTVLMGNAVVNTSNIDNITTTINVSDGDTLAAGTMVLSGNIVLRAERTYDDSTVSGMVLQREKLAKDITVHEKRILNIISYSVLICCLAGILGFIIAAIVNKSTKLFVYGAVWTCFVCCADSFRSLLHNTYINAATRCSNNGIVAKNKKLVEKSMFIKNLLFRKQGVLTKRSPIISKIVPVEGVSESELLQYAAYAQYNATNTLSTVINLFCGKKVKPEEIAHFMETENNGAMVQLKNGIEIMTGTSKVLSDFGVISGIISEEAVLCVAVNNVFIGHIVFEYEIKEDIKQYVDSLKYAGAKNLSIVTRDSERAAKSIAAKSGIKRYFSELDTGGIENVVNKLGKNTIYVGYGKGDSYQFNKECVKLMFGGFLHDTPTTDGLLLSDSLGCILKFFNIIKDTRMLVLQNLIISLLSLAVLIYLTVIASDAVVGGGLLVVVTNIICSLNGYRMYKKI